MHESITTILIPGRHHLLTNFQHEYLSAICDSRTARDVNGETLHFAPELRAVWAITSANHSNTRRNPIPANRREAMIERFSANLKLETYTYLINDIGQSDRFADHMLKDIDVQSDNQLEMSPANTVVATSTPDVMKLFEAKGFRILPLELDDRSTVHFSTPRAWELVQAIVKAGDSWRSDEQYLKFVHEASRHILEKYNLGDIIVRLHTDSLIGDEGDITETRNYNTYARSFDEGAERKYATIAPFILPGRIMDVGCATGSLLRCMGNDDRFRESDLYGIEVARRLYDICERRRADGEFPNQNTFFYKRNIAEGKLFHDNTLNTVTTLSLTHEIFSYVNEEALRNFLRNVYEQLAPGGRYINLDVVGPDNKDEIVFFKLNKEDGSNDDPLREFSREDHPAFKEHLDGLSSFSRFLRFAADFRKAESESVQYEVVERDGETFVKLRLEDAAEYLSKKEYTENWESEMHERFCFWNFDLWKKALEEAGFVVSKDSHAFQNPWIVEHSYRGAGELFTEIEDKLVQVGYPVTNTLLVAEKR